MKIRTLSVSQAKALDERARREYEIPALLLMENAGRGLAHYIQHAMIPPIHKCKVVMLCGLGNNGGDAFAAARHLLQVGVRSHLFFLGDTERLREEALVNYRMIEKLKLPCEAFSLFEQRQKEWLGGIPVLVVDALMGLGFQIPVRDPALKGIQAINRFKKMHNTSVRILSVDIPSGFHGDQGAVGEAVRADLTVTMACIKQAMAKPEARPYVGRIEVVDIGIPEELLLNI